MGEHRALPALLLCVACCLLALPCQAGERFWSGPDGGDWDDPNHWTPTGQPDPADDLYVQNGLAGEDFPEANVEIDSDGQVTIENSGSAKVGDITAGTENQGQLNVRNGGNLTADSIQLGRDASATGHAQFDGAGAAVDVDGKLTAGYHGEGYVSVASQAQINLGSLTLGDYGGSYGQFSISDNGTVVDIETTLQVGRYGAGELVVAKSAQVSAGWWLDTARMDGAAAEVHVDYFATLTVADWQSGGGTGATTHTKVTNGGTLNSGWTTLARRTGSEDEVELTGSSQWNTRGLTIGDHGHARVYVGGKSDLHVDGSLVAGNWDDARGDITVWGANSTLSVTQHATLGAYGRCSLEITGGASMDVGGTLYTSQRAGSDDPNTAILISGEGSRLHADGGMRLGSNGPVDVIIEAAGRVDANGPIYIGHGSQKRASVIVRGPGSSLQSDNDIYLASDMTLLQVADGATTELGGNFLMGPYSLLELYDGRVEAVGNVNMVENNLTVAGVSDVAAVSQPLIEAGAEADIGGTLVLDLLQAPQLGEEFVLLSAAMGVEGMFDTVLGMDAGDWKLAVLYEPDRVVVRATAPGDATCDDIISEADLGILAAHWQQTGQSWATGDFTGDGRVSEADLAILAARWQQEYGSTIPPMTIPEPATLTILAVGLAGLVRRRR